MSLLCNNCECVNINGVRCHEKGCPNDGKRIVLADDGSLDTVFECLQCGASERYNMGDCECKTAEECEEEGCYENFKYESFREFQDEHECGGSDLEDDEEWT